MASELRSRRQVALSNVIKNCHLRSSASTVVSCWTSRSHGRILEGRESMGDKGGKKDKDKGQKQKVSKQNQEAKRKLEKEPKRTP